MGRFKICFACLILIGFQQAFTSEKDDASNEDLAAEQVESVGSSALDATSAEGRMTKKDAKAACRNEGKKGKDLKSCMKEKAK